MRIKLSMPNRTIAEQLTGMGFPPDLRCGGAGRCGRCKVHLLSGEWRQNGVSVLPGESAYACQTRLTGAEGEVEIPDVLLAPHAGKLESAWVHRRPLPENSEPVIGIDLGSTTIAAAKMLRGVVVQSEGVYNPQSVFGDNVISRIAAAADPKKRKELQLLVLGAVSELIQKLSPVSGSPRKAAVAGNTVMSCLLHGIDPAPLGHAPFSPPQTEFPVRRDLLNRVELHTIPCISGFLGGDLTAGLEECRLSDGEMLVDLGTNCEMIFRSGDQYFGTSAAAGPAFEGAGIGCGSRAVKGAAERYFGFGNVFTVGDIFPATGLCGSALIDVLAVERRNGNLTEFGRFPQSGERLEILPKIFLSESEVEQLLKAKAAVCAGILALESIAGRSAETIHLAGGFAASLDLANAVRIGMLPERQYRKAGNTSLAGALRLAAEPQLAMEWSELGRKVKEIPLNDIPAFAEFYRDALRLP